MIAGDNGWDDPVSLPEDDDTTIGAIAPTPAPPPPPRPPAVSPPLPPPPPAAASTGSGPNRTVLIAGGALALVALVAVVVLVAGGGSSSHKTPPGPAPGESQAAIHAKFVTDANAICGDELPGATTAIQNQDAQGAETAFTSLANRIGALTTATADDAAVKQFLSQVDASVAALRAGNASEFQQDITSAGSLGGQLGLHVCETGK